MLQASMEMLNEIKKTLINNTDRGYQDKRHNATATNTVNEVSDYQEQRCKRLAAC